MPSEYFTECALNFCMCRPAVFTQGTDVHRQLLFISLPLLSY